MSEFKSVNMLAEEWGLSTRSIRAMCQSGKINGATKIGNVWVIPEDATRPKDMRETTGQYKDWRKTKEDK